VPPEQAPGAGPPGVGVCSLNRESHDGTEFCSESSLRSRRFKPWRPPPPGEIGGTEYHGYEVCVGGFGGRTALPVNLDEFEWEKTETEVHWPHLGE
jgi:hypothetical protein